MGKYVLRPSEYESLRAQEPCMRGFVVFAPENGDLVSQEVIPRKHANSILGNPDSEDIKIYAKIAELERKYVPFWRGKSDRDFANMVEIFETTRLINAFIFMENDRPQLYEIQHKSGITSAVPLELRLLVAAHEVR